MKSSERSRREAPISARLKPEGHEINARLLGGPAMFVRERFGSAALDTLLSEAGISARDVSDTRRFVSSRAYERFLSGVRALVSDDAALSDACTHRLREAYGPARFIMWATTPKSVLKLAARTLRIVMPRARCEVLRESERDVTLRYSSAHAVETRVMCLSRQAACMALPTLFGLPKAQVRERGCIADGDAACVYEVSFIARPRFLPALLLGAITLLGVHVTARLGVSWATPLMLSPVLVMFAAYAYEARRVFAENLRASSEVQAALEALAKQEVEARSEVFAFHQRQRQWAALLEAQVEERTEKLSDVLARIERLREARTHHLLGFSHDLRNPLTILRISADSLDAYRHVLPDEGMVVDDVRYAVERMEAMLSDMASTLSEETALERRGTERMPVKDLHDSVRRRMSALMFGRDVRVTSELGTPPEAIDADPLVVDRIMDNLLTNAAKYTERGSITLRFDGAPGYLVISVTDTGRGIARERIAQIFRVRGGDPEARASYSLGVGLSVVLRLLAQVGGKLEVASEVGRGSSFTVFFPEAMRVTPSIAARTHEGMRDEDLFAMVVSIRRCDGLEYG
jgi:signal transduction histidine kinase